MTETDRQPLTAAPILAFWFAPGMEKRWFRSTAALDREIRERFESHWHDAAAGRCWHWTADAEGSLALVILLDQLPLNMFRGEPASFRTETQAVAVTLKAIAQGQDQALSGHRQAFLYMPLMHSEDLAHQDRSVALFEAAGLDDNLRFARHHRELIRRFGRFPHRNAILGRHSTQAELDYLASKGAFTG